MSAQCVRPATVKTRTGRDVVELVIEAERGEGILCLRNGFALSDQSERGLQIVGQG